MTDDELKMLTTLREELYDGIKRSLELDPHCKSYEGTVSVTFPSYFQANSKEPQPSAYSVTIDCYVLGPSRHYTYSGPTLEKALKAARNAVEGWLLDLAEWEREDAEE